MSLRSARYVLTTAGKIHEPFDSMAAVRDHLNHRWGQWRLERLPHRDAYRVLVTSRGEEHELGEVW